MKIDVLFWISYPILLNNVLDYMVFLINDHDMFTMYNGDIEDLVPITFL